MVVLPGDTCTPFSIDQSPGDGDAVTSQVEGSLAAEVSMVVLDTLDLIVQILIANDTYNQVLPHLLKVLLGGLHLNQSASVLVHMFAMQRSIVSKVRAPALLSLPVIACSICFKSRQSYNV